MSCSLAKMLLFGRLSIHATVNAGTNRHQAKKRGGKPEPSSPADTWWCLLGLRFAIPSTSMSCKHLKCLFLVVEYPGGPVVHSL